MRTKALRYGIGAMGVLLAALACGETENDSDSSGMDDGTVGSSVNTGSGGSNGGDGPATVGGNAVTHTVAADSVSAIASSAGGLPSTTTGTATVVGAGGVAISDTTTGSSVGGAGGAGGAGGVSAAGGGGGAPPITECLGCAPSTESFGQDCQVWVCFAAGEGMQRLADAGCMDLATQVPRYCCPPGVEPDCD